MRCYLHETSSDRNLRISPFNLPIICSLYAIISSAWLNLKNNTNQYAWNQMVSSLIAMANPCALFTVEKSLCNSKPVCFTHCGKIPMQWQTRALYSMWKNPYAMANPCVLLTVEKSLHLLQVTVYGWLIFKWSATGISCFIRLSLAVYFDTENGLNM